MFLIYGNVSNLYYTKNMKQELMKYIIMTKNKI